MSFDREAAFFIFIRSSRDANQTYVSPNFAFTLLFQTFSNVVPVTTGCISVSIRYWRISTFFVKRSSTVRSVILYPNFLRAFSVLWALSLSGFIKISMSSVARE